MARDTIYTLYSTGRADPTYTNIWGFTNSTERDAFFNGKAHIRFSQQKYWRVGATIKIPIRYEQALQYDYIIIDNDTTDAQNARRWYGFIDAKAYVSPEVTLITISVDWIQTFYFLSGVPFWQYTGFITRSTNHSLPPDGTPSDFPVPQTRCVSFTHETGGYALVMYASVSPANAIAGELEYTSATVDGVPMSSPPYILKGSSMSNLIQTLVNTVDGYNSNGMTDTITGIYLIPDTYLPSNIGTNVWVNGWSVTLPTRNVTITPPTSALEYGELITKYNYTNLIINNGQGETDSYSFNDFNGSPVFQLSASLSAGSPTLFCRPYNLKYNQNDANERIIKITQAPAIGWLNDSYKIWLAQTQNSRAASIAGAELAISQAEEARQNSWAYKYGSTIRNIESSIISQIPTSRIALPGSTNEVSQAITSQGKPGNVATDALGYGLASVIGALGNWGIQQNYGDGAEAEHARRTASTGIQTTENSLLRDTAKLGALYLNYQLGIETTYIYDQKVASAQQSLNQLLAGYTDKARIPATARGSNAYGDMAKYQQYGFMFAVFAPSADSLALINNMIAAGGHTVNRYQAIVKAHTVFDFIQANAVKIPADPANRPQFVRKMMLGLLQTGVYLWYYNNGDISSFIGSPYGLSNEYIE